MSEAWDYLRQNWLLNSSEVVPESNAVHNNNFVLFYGIHGMSICLQIISLTSCSLVILFIVSSWMKQRSWDFSDRFPLGLAILDLLWGPAHLTDEILIVIRKTYPSSATCTAMGTYLWMFFGYQILVNVGLVLYMYFKVVWHKQIHLGFGEWKLHAVCAMMTLICIAGFTPFESFGCSGFWFLNKTNTTSGIVLGYYMAITGAAQALCTTLGYRSIRKTIEAQKKRLTKSGIHPVSGNFRHHSVATECLTTFVRIAEILYCTLAVSSTAFMIQVSFGVQEPITIFVMITAGLSGGWANAVGYFYNKRVKARKTGKPFLYLTSASAFPSTS